MFTESEKNLIQVTSLLRNRGIPIEYKASEGDKSDVRDDTLSQATKDAILDRSKSKIVSTPSSVEKLETLLKAVQENRVVLVEGPGGCGKTTLVEVLTRGVRDVAGCVTIFMGEQTDSKVLLGTFLCTGTPGEFLWKPGVLARAIMDKKWVVIEDIDRSPPNVVSLLIPLIKYGTLQLPGYHKPLYTTKGFRLIATRRLTSDGLVQSPSSKLFETLEQKLCKVRLDSTSTSELCQIAEVKYPELAGFLPNLMRLMSSSLSLDSRQFLKLCRRISPMIHQGRILSVEDAVLECIDVCFGLETDSKKEQRVTFITEIFQNITTQKVLHLCSSHKPVLQLTDTALSIGRAYLPSKLSTGGNVRVAGTLKYAHTQSSLSMLEKITRCVQMNEPALLVGETGVGKTAAISYLAKATGHELVVVNMSQQSDSSDLLGGFKPVDVGHLVTPMRETFEFLFRRTFSVKQNAEFLGYVQSSYAKKQWKALLQTMIFSAKEATKKTSESVIQYLERWAELLVKMKKVYQQLTEGEGSMAFAFVEGSLIKAMNNGQWILLDEINLATPETLQCLSSLLEGPLGTFLLIDRGDSEPVARHEDFRMFGCMNPATDHGKTPLPPHIRNRFTEFYVEEMKHTEDLRQLVLSYFPGQALPGDVVEGVIKFYREVKTLAENRLADGTGRRPHFSLRTLCRALLFAGTIHHTNIGRALYEGLCMSFISQVSREQHVMIRRLCQTSLGLSASLLRAPLPRPKGPNYVQVEEYWLQQGDSEAKVPEGYILTPSVKENLKNLARIVCGSCFPILLQGPTSSGKTSLVRWLADVTGHRCVRINNHEHTDIQEYIGMYTADKTGKLVFKEGVLVEAMRKGYWVILDELNLAPTEVLEALNRVLDDNRELFITETQSLVKAHPHFRVFGTQNPPGAYGGRKFLSRAFRNRFIELHFDEIPPVELVTILYQTSGVPESYAEKMIAVMQELQRHRSTAVVFAGKYGLITLRDLFKWAGRYAKTESKSTFNDWEQVLAEDGYLILAGRARHAEDEEVIINTLKSHFKKIVDPKCLFGWTQGQRSLTSEAILSKVTSSHEYHFEHVVWTEEMKRMAVLVGRAVLFKEPVLLVGETGCGKTTLCQLLCSLMERKLHSINCHMYTEASDFLGGLRPARRTRKDNVDEEDKNKLFEWCDGILVQAMLEGSGLLIDEISLAEDAVLERLNSILEQERKVLVAERGNELGGAYEVIAEEGFILFATMNPGGDYGKRELSPALRNRFTEVWCPPFTACAGLRLIAHHNLLPQATPIGGPWEAMMTEFMEWLRQRQKNFKVVVSTRDLMAWIHFFNKTVSESILSPSQAFHHGACLVFLDAFQTDTTHHGHLHRSALDKLSQLLSQSDQKEDSSSSPVLMDNSSQEVFGIHPFFISKGAEAVDESIPYTLEPPGPQLNAFRLLRALQISKPLLLEGPPGVGKTTLVAALARASGHKLTRICLSEQTDLTELFGSDLPDETSEGVKFTWRDGPFLRALKDGHWIVLDEMNLASQSVLEGLNACLDHRSEVYIPALDLTFAVSKDTCIFACQNPVVQGGGRKQLPKSFVNRFTKVYMEKLSSKDLLLIACALYPDIDREIIKKMIKFNKKMASVVDKEKVWEFNLRDVLRWCELMVKYQTSHQWDPGQFVGIIYIHRLRKEHRIEKAIQLYSEQFPPERYPPPHVLTRANLLVSPRGISVSRAILPREHFGQYYNLYYNYLQMRPSQLPYMEAMLTCIELNWMAILVGGPNSGKSSLVHVLAQLTGHKVVEFPVNSSMDTTDLVGGYVQMNSCRHVVNLTVKAKDIALECVMNVVKHFGSLDFEVGSRDRKQAGLSQLCGTIDRLSEIEKDLLGNDGEKSSSDVTFSCVTQLKEELSNIQSLLSSLHLTTEVNDERMSDLTQSLDNWSRRSETQFEWVDSTLVTALKEGHWLVVSNANFCSPSVLDRLNALLEPGGVLTVDERGAIDGEIPVIKPHPSFRLFMTMDPKYGELSKAMRNRGIEIFIHHKMPSPESSSLCSIPMLSLSKDISMMVDSWVVCPLATQVRHHMLPILRTLTDDTSVSLKKLPLHLDVFSDVCLRSDIDLREELLLLLSNEVNPSIKPLLMDGMNYLQALRTQTRTATVKDSIMHLCQDVMDPRSHPFIVNDNERQQFESDDLKLYCTRVSYWKMSSKAMQLLEKLKRLATSHSGRGLTLLQLSKATSTGSVSSAVLTHRNITKLYNMLECLLTVLRTLFEGCCMAVHNLGEQCTLLCSWLVVVLDTVTTVNGSWLALSVGWDMMWRDVVKFATSLMENADFKKLNMVNALEEFTHHIRMSLDGPSFWLQLWSMFDHQRLHVSQQLANCWRATRSLCTLLRHKTSIAVTTSHHTLPWELSAQHSSVVNFLTRVWMAASTPGYLLSEDLSTDVTRLHNSLTTCQSSTTDDSLYSEVCEQQSYSSLVSCTALLVLRRINLQLLENDILKAIEECCSLDEYLKRVNFPLDVKASVKLLAELKGDPMLSQNHTFFRDLLYEAKSKVSSLAIKSRQVQQQQQQQQQQQETVSQEVMAALCIGTNAGHFPRTSPFEGSPVQVTIEDSETISNRLSSLHAQLWESALNGSVSPGLHCSMECGIQLRHYKNIVSVLYTVGAKCGPTPPPLGDQILSDIVSLRTLPSELGVLFEKSTVSTALDLLDHSCVRLRSLQLLTIECVNLPEKATAMKDQAICDIGLVSVCNGLASANLMSPQLDFNPFKVAKTEQNVLKELLETLKMRFRAFQEHFDNVSSCLLTSDRQASEHWMPPCVKDISENIKKVTAVMSGENSRKLSQVNTGADEEFLRLSRQCGDLMSTVCSKEKVLAMTTGLEEGQVSVLPQAEGWLMSVTSALNTLESDFVEFSDILLPWKLGLLQVIEGILMLFLYSRSQMLKPPSLTLMRSLQPNWGNPLMSHTKKLISAILQFLNSVQSGYLKKKLVLSGVELLARHARSLGVLPVGCETTRQSLIGSAVDLWREAEEAQRRKEEEESALFWYKEKSHTVTEENESTLVETLFPNFETDFEILEANENGTERIDMETDQFSSSVESEVNDPKVPLFTPLEMSKVVAAFLQVTGSDSSIDDLLGFRRKPADDPFHALYQCVAAECQKSDLLQPILPFLSNFDKELMFAHLKELVIYTHLYCDDEERSLVKGSRINVYQESLSSEYKNAREVLLNLISTCSKYLEEWPEHPVLNKIVTSCQVVLSLSNTTPLMKVLAGLEYVLRQTQEWEMYASSHVSLSVEIERLTGLILKWRKLELSCWEVLMDMEDVECCRNTSKWWFHVHQTLAKLQEGQNDTTLEDVLQVLQTFLQSSCIGDYAVRVNIVRVFATSVTANPQLLAVLQNLTAFHTQFIEPVCKQKDKLREPLEKEFKDHVSLLRWNDGNYWALKDAIKKNHMAVAHLIRKYKEVLSQPVQPLLATTCLPKSAPGTEELSPSTVSALWSSSSEVPVCPAESSHVPVLCVTLGTGDSIGVDTAHQQLRKHHKDILTDTTLVDALRYVQESLANISLQMEDISKPVSLSDVVEDKRKSEGKLQLQLKKRSLTDLFKFLGASGFSYKKGSKEMGRFVKNFMYLPILSCSTNSSCLDSSFVKHVSLSNSIFYSVAARVVGLNTAMLKPSKELSFGELSRIEGLSGSFLTLLEKQRTVLSLSVEHLEYLIPTQQTLVATVSELCNGDEDNVVFVAGRTSLEHSEEMVSVLEQCVEVIEGVRSLKDMYPHQLNESQGDVVECERPLWLKDEGGRILEEAVHKLESLIPGVRCALIRVDSTQNRSGIFTFVDMYKQTKQFSDTLSSVRDELTGMIEVLFTPPPPSFGPFSCFVEFLKTSSDVLQRMHGVISQGTDSILNFDSEIRTAVVDIVKVILLGVQGLIKTYQSVKDVAKQQDSESEGDFEDSVLFKLVFLTTVDLLCSLQGEKVVSAVRSLTNLLSTVSGNFSASSYHVMVLTSFLGCYNTLLRGAAHLLLLSHSYTGQYLYKLLEMFLNIVEKGFGIPDLDQKTEDIEGPSEFVDIEGGGFDEGEGGENVSKGNEDLKEQLENAGKSSDQEENEKEGHETRDEDDDGIEMDFDFHGQIEDVDKDDEENPDSNEGEESEEISEKLGDLGNDPGDILDKNIWDPQEDEDQAQDLQELPDANVEGTDTKDDPELVAKDKNDTVSDEQRKDPSSPKDGDVDPLPDDWEMNDNDSDNEGEPDQDLDAENEKSKADPQLQDQGEEEDVEGDDTVDQGEGTEEGEEENLSAEEEKQHIDTTHPLENKEEFEAEDPEPERDCVLPQEDAIASQVPEDQISNVQSTPNTSNVKSESSAVDGVQGSEPDQLQNLANQVDRGYEMMDLKQPSSENTGQQTAVKSTRPPPSSRKPAPPETVPSAKRLKLSKELLDSQKEERQGQKSSLYAHVEDESVWDEHALDTAPPGHEGMRPVLEELEEENSGEEEMDVENVGEGRTADDIVKGLASEVMLPNVEEQKTDTSEDDGEQTDSESASEELEMETDNEQLSFYHLDTAYFQDSRQTILQDIEEALKIVEESTVLLQDQEEATVDATELWSKYEALTLELSQSLYENIRITFEPTLATQFKGDFRSGKRLNIRRLIPYIASHYQNDRIWLRRSKPSRMNYQVLVAVDDSSSMAENKCRLTAFKSLAAISGALSRLEGVSFGISRFGDGVDILKRFGEYMSTETGGLVLKNMTFRQKRTNFVKLLKHSTALLNEEQRLSLHRSRGGRNQLLIVLSDGRGVFMDGTQAMEKAVREINEEGIFSVFIILDPLQKDSVLSIRIPIFRQGEAPSFKPYLEAFPFPYYIILKDIESLPSVLGESLQQWFQLVNERTKGQR